MPELLVIIALLAIGGIFWMHRRGKLRLPNRNALVSRREPSLEQPNEPALVIKRNNRSGSEQSELDLGLLAEPVGGKLLPEYAEPERLEQEGLEEIPPMAAPYAEPTGFNEETLENVADDGFHMETVEDEMTALEAPLKESTTTATEPGERVLAFTLLAQENAWISGGKLEKRLDSMGLLLGEDGFYQKRSALNSIIFSVANVLTPGTFNEATMAGLETPGIMLFARLPRHASSWEQFIEIVEAAEYLSERFDAELCDDRRQPMSSGQLAALQNDIASWLHPTSY